MVIRISGCEILYDPDDEGGGPEKIITAYAAHPNEIFRTL